MNVLFQDGFNVGSSNLWEIREQQWISTITHVHIQSSVRLSSLKESIAALDATTAFFFFVDGLQGKTECSNR